jgi:hypothetical protein
MQCPGCDRSLRLGAKSCSCGWKSPNEHIAPTVAPDRWRCSWLAGIEQCHYPGAISHGTKGDGPFYCRHHFFCGDPVTGQRIVEESRDWQRGAAVPLRAKPALKTFAITNPDADDCAEAA